MKLVTWNIRKCVGLDRRRDPHRVGSIIAGMSPDVVVLQEADRRLGERPAALPHDVVDAVTGLRPLQIAGNDVSLGWHGNAILLAEGVEASDVVTLDLPGLEPRGAVIADLSNSGIEVRIVAVHLGLLRRSRKRQLRVIQDKLSELPERPTVVMGDFNEWSFKRGLGALSNFDIHAPGQSFHSARPIAALDRIAITRDLELTEAGVEDTAVTRRASDHLPVWGRIGISQAA
ncbi:MAG: endonuclease/exonuclease/phosphatase family protein [Boseongicola sp.]|nr:endonuclease/exonuclease/phosphatase family protein [Boseongicola sp.]